MRAFWSHFVTWFTNHVSPYWSPSGLISMTPPQTWVFEKGYVIMLALFLVGGLVSLFVKRIPEGLRRRFNALCWNNLVIGLILFFFRYQRIPLLGMDIWRFVQEIVLIVWLVIIFRYWRRQLPKERFSEQVIAHKQKYLPKKKS